jgi:O-acetylserine/cysteine efflux transporter
VYKRVPVIDRPWSHVDSASAQLVDGLGRSGAHKPAIVQQMSAPDLLIAALLIIVWSSNFVVAAIGLTLVPPFTLATLRFVLAAFPAVLFVRRPNVPWTRLASFGALFGLGQFGLLFLSIREGVTPTLASIIIQMQVFFTTALASLFFGERVRLHNVIALAVAASGLVLIGEGGSSAPAAGLTLAMLAAFAWALCNMIGRRVDRAEMPAFIIWSSLFAVPPLLVATFWIEGFAPLASTILRPNLEMAGIVAWQSFANTIWGYTIWNRLLGRYTAAQVAPLTLPVPIIAGLLSTLILEEQIVLWKIEACVLVLAGLAVNFVGGRRRSALGK